MPQGCHRNATGAIINGPFCGGAGRTRLAYQLQRLAFFGALQALPLYRAARERPLKSLTKARFGVRSRLNCVQRRFTLAWTLYLDGSLRTIALAGIYWYQGKHRSSSNTLPRERSHVR